MANTTIPRDIELQEPLGRDRGRVRITETDEPEGAGYGDTSNQIWKLYATESEKHDKALVDSWKSNADSMLIFTGLFSSVVASFLIETYKTLLPDNSSQTVSLLTQLVAQSDGTAATSPQTSVPQSITLSAVRVNILMVLSLFFSMTSALVSTLIQQWAREYLQYSQPSAAPHKRGRVRTYLFDGLSQFQMRRLNYSVPVLLHLGVFLFFFALSEWLYSINIPVGATARYSLVALFAVYMALSVLPLIVRNAPYQTALTTPLQAIISLIHISYLFLLRLLRRSSRALETQKGYRLLRNVNVDRARALLKEIQRKESTLDRSAMHWLLQELDEDDMDTFLGGLPGFIHSPLTDTKLVVEGLREDGVPGRIRGHFNTCVTSVELSQEESMSRASSCISSLRLISETSTKTSVGQPGLEDDNIQAIVEYLEPLCYISSPKTALRASCMRSLLIREFLFPFAHSDAEELSRTKFPEYLMPLYRVIRLWKTTEVAQWSHLLDVSRDTADPLPSEPEMWADILFDGPLINLAVLAFAVLTRTSEEEVNMAWGTLETLQKALSLAQVRASAPARARFDQILLIAHASVSKHEGGRTQITPLIEALDTVVSGIYLAEVFAYLPNPRLSPRRIEAIFGKEQLRDSELLEAFSAHLPGFVAASTPETSRTFMERLILENKLWEQLHVGLSGSLDSQLSFPDKLRIVMAFYDILDIAFEVLKDWSKINWHSLDFFLLSKCIDRFWAITAPSMFTQPVARFRGWIAGSQICHLLLAQLSIQRSRGEPIVSDSLDALERVVLALGLGSQEDREYFKGGNSRIDPNVMLRAEAILHITIRDGPLFNFCSLGRRTFELMITETSDLSSEDMKRPWTALRRMLDATHLPLVNAPQEMWAEFDRLLAAVRSAVALESSHQNAKKLRPLLEMIEEVNQMRPAPDERAEEMGDQASVPPSLLHDAWQFGEAPVPRSNRRGDPPLSEIGSPVYPIHIPPIGDVIPTDEMSRLSPGASTWIPPTRADPSAMGADQPPTTSVLTTQSGPSTWVPYPHLPHASRVHPLSFAPPHIPSMSGPRRASSLDTAMLPVGVHERSMFTSMPVPLGYMGTHMYPPSSPNSGPVDAPPLDHVNQGGPVPARAPGGFPTPDFNYEGNNPGGE